MRSIPHHVVSCSWNGCSANDGTHLAFTSRRTWGRRRTGPLATAPSSPSRHFDPSDSSAALLPAVWLRWARLPPTVHAAAETTRIRAPGRQPVVPSRPRRNSRTIGLACAWLERASQSAGLGDSALGADPLVARCHQLLCHWSIQVRAAGCNTPLPLYAADCCRYSRGLAGCRSRQYRTKPTARHAS